MSGRDGFLYVREADGPLETASVVEIARHNGVIRYALAPGSDTYDAHDPGWRFILARVRGIGTDNFDRVFDEAVNDLLDTNITLSPDIRQIIKGDRQTARDPKRRERNKDDALAFAVENHVRFVAGLLRDAGYKDAQTRAAEHAADHWRKIISKMVAARASTVVERSPCGCDGTVAAQKTPRKCNATAGARSLPTTVDRGYLCVS